jgi:hypothetical protein
LVSSVEDVLKSLSKSSWKMYKTDSGGKVVENGVQIMIGHEEYNEILLALHKEIYGGE